MSRLIGVAFLFFLIQGFAGYGQSSIELDVLQYRDSVDRVFSDPELTILSDEYLDNFDGLPYYPYDEVFRVQAWYESLEGQEVFQMKTTTDRIPEYLPAGRLHFTLGGQELELTVYRNVELTKKDEYKDYLFVPFTDLSNGETTYLGGRYLDFRAHELGDTCYIDFNTCYNPYCVYSKRYSCPIPPIENHLTVKIEAGIKAFRSEK